jgi:hypothetical protein
MHGGRQCYQAAAPPPPGVKRITAPRPSCASAHERMRRVDVPSAARGYDRAYGGTVPPEHGENTMSRTLASASEIRRLIQARLYAADALGGACRECHANQVHKRAPTPDGCNWELHSFNGPAQCADVVAAIVAELQQSHNLED